MSQELSQADVLARVAATLESRKPENGGDPEKSYVAKLFKKGDDAILKKIGEEATETVMAAKDARVSIEPDELRQLSAAADAPSAYAHLADKHPELLGNDKPVLSDKVRELKTFQFFNLPPNVSNVALRHALHLRTSSASSGKPQKQADLIERETQFTRPAHE